MTNPLDIDRRLAASGLLDETIAEFEALTDWQLHDLRTEAAAAGDESRVSAIDTFVECLPPDQQIIIGQGGADRP